ncbi:MAG: RNA polymerase subunit sigma, partial [Planctomycetes bacterium]|nr:RNA polymerase subunit sigma [Planctomycetota bacterium]
MRCAMLDLTRLLNDAARGLPGAADQLLPLVYEQLRAMARRQVARDPATIEPTALVHEAWLRLAPTEGAAWNHRGHFFGAAAQAMRRILVEQARARRA